MPRSRPASTARSVARASDQEHAELARRTGGAQRGTRLGDLDGQIDFRAPAGAVGVGNDRAADAVQGGGDRVRGQPRGEPLEPLLVTCERRRRSRHAPASRLGCRSQVRLLGRRVAERAA